MKIGFAVPAASTLAKTTGTIAAGVFADKVLGPAAKELDALTRGAVARAVKNARFAGKKGEVFGFPAPAGLAASHVLLFGLGAPDKLDAEIAEEAGGAVMARLLGLREKSALVLAALPGTAKLKPGSFAAHFAFGAHLRAYRFDKYRTKEKPEDKPVLAGVTIALKAVEDARKQFAPLAAIAEGIFLTRDVVSEPPNVIYPETLAQRAKTLTRDGVKVEVLDVAQMKKLGMGALLGVGQGSVRDSRLVVMRWEGGKKGVPPVAFIGKGVTFDTGGISIKPAKGMEDMKWDMAGAGTVIGLMKALAGRKAKVNAVGVVGLVENMPDGNAQRPGDVVKTMSGQTVEVINTDAEGRLVLADAMWYCQDRFKPKFMVDLATLTGAIIMSLGTHRAGLFSNDDKLSENLKAAGSAVGEKLWRMPLGPEYDKMLTSQIADMMNVSDGGGAGSITAAQFLQRFVNDVPWAHLDIAGMAWSKRDTAMVPKGATAFGVRLLDRLVADHYEGR
ncbi:MAG TPA: leucyl aminopeptidase [Alphaproteobacteria bacterium]|jgi:leucyl aminopeptidase